MGQAELLAHPQVPLLGCRARRHRQRRGRQRRDPGADGASRGVGPTSPTRPAPRPARRGLCAVASRSPAAAAAARSPASRLAARPRPGQPSPGADVRARGLGQHGSSHRQRFAAGGSTSSSFSSTPTVRMSAVRGTGDRRALREAVGSGLVASALGPVALRWASGGPPRQRAGPWKQPGVDADAGDGMLPRRSARLRSADAVGRRTPWRRRRCDPPGAAGTWVPRAATAWRQSGLNIRTAGQGLQDESRCAAVGFTTAGSSSPDRTTHQDPIGDPRKPF